ncbi:MAG: sensor histidine kinase [Bacteroidota bacterium]
MKIKKWLYCTGLLTLFALGLLGQNAVIDSFKQLIVQEENDSLRLWHHFNMARYQLAVDITSSRTSLKFIIEQSKKYGLPIFEVKANNGLGVTYFYTNQLDSARYYFQKAVDAEDVQLPEMERLKIYLNYGLALNNLNDKEGAIDHYLRAFNTIDTAAFPQSIPIIYGSLGTVEMSRNSAKALEYFLVAEDQVEQLDTEGIAVDEVKIMEMYHNLTKIYYELGNYQKAMRYAYKTYSFTASGTIHIVETYNLMGACYKEYHMLDSAFYFFEAAIKENQTDPDQLVQSHLGLSSLHSVKKDFKRALEEAHMAYELAKNGGDEFRHLQVLKQLTSLYLETKRYAKMKQYLDEAHQIYDSSEVLKDEYLDKYTIAYEIAVNAGEEVLTKYYHMIDHLDSFYEVEKTRVISELDIKHESEKKAIEIEHLRDSEALNTTIIQQQKSNMMLTGIGFLFSIVIALVLYNRNQIKKRLNDELAWKNSQVESKNSELELKNSQVLFLIKELNHRVKDSLHYVSSLLNLQLKSLADGQSIEAIREGQQRVDALNLLHQKFYYQPNQSLNINMRAYLVDLIRKLVRSFDPQEIVELDLEIDDFDLDMDRALPVGLIVNELMTNFYRHNFLKKQEGKISLKWKQGEQITLVVEDDGEGLPTNFDELKGKSFGMKVVEMLSQELNGVFKIENVPGVRFELVFPK